MTNNDTNQNNYNPLRKNKPRTCFNSSPVFTQSADDISQEQIDALKKAQIDMINRVRKDLENE